ncbi:putative Tetratricopeptide repeat NMDA receptor regulated protein 1 [Trypanosoma vivax]|uniref:Putative N-acetyltransferase subunit Nat1 n=1 Tax=Trypanosoma vivax (strain Y486) TaxID=1055687 RepID=G0U6L9_TRYVY|nr:putative N-acetyltransferase subunit Nat1 [Trypanosoma vivax]KAH8611258.1 putative Tetratricopeptide repeat NMDA receptor regulated protein 1 [Trypanosoma vivax]CCC51523.1 putative N-acetyltransferase subunit Nat1 [Trypanosoma vivax Y486]
MTARLPPQQQKLFEKLGREFDSREYSKALRTADNILSLSPGHADTLAMRGLTLHCMDRKEEGYAAIREATTLNASSAIAWHSLGMCYRSDKDYSEAIEAFKTAHKCDPHNANVLRDISSLCVQVRDWELFVNTRQKMVTLKAGVRANWIALSCGHRMLGNTDLAAAVMDVMTTIMDAGDNGVEKSEVHLYRVELELERNDPARALELLEKHSDEIIDVYEKMRLRAKTFTLLGNKSEAEKHYMDLIACGMAEADCVAAIARLRGIPLDSARCPVTDVDRYLELLKEILAAHPKSEYAKRQVLECVPTEEFSDYLREYAATFITKAIPSLFSVLKSLYRSPERVEKITKVFLQWERELSNDDFSSFNGTRNPSYILWVMAFLASHYCRLREFECALGYIERAIRHTPTVEFLYLMKAKILGRSGQVEAAAECADTARRLDLQDKYINVKAAKYFFRANRIREGEQRMQMFYKPTLVPDDIYLTALESQCAWYEREVGDAYYRMGDYISALSNYLVHEESHRRNHMELIEFHNYVFRRCTVRPWFDVIARDDDLEGNRFFQKLCPRIVRTYMKIHEEGEEAVRAKHVPRPEVGHYEDQEEGKRMQQLRRDLYLSNINIADPLSKANRYMQAHLAHSSETREPHLLAVSFYTQWRKPLLVARALLALAKLEEPSTRDLVAQFQKDFDLDTDSSVDVRAKEVVREAIATALSELK